MQMMDGEYACAAIIRKKKTNGYVNVVACRALKGILFKGAESLKRKKIFDRKKKKFGKNRRLLKQKPRRQ